MPEQQASYGVRQLAIRLPKAIASPSHYKPYCLPDLISLQTTEKSVLINISIAAQNYGGWLSEESRLAEIVDIREALFDLDLISAAATHSETVSAPSAEPIEAWIAELSEAERNHYLLRVAQGERNIGIELIQKLREQFGQQPTTLTGQIGSRTFAELEAAAQQKSNEQVIKAKAEAEKIEQQWIESPIPQVEKLWQLIRHLIERGQAKTDDEAVAHLVDLQAITTLQNNSTTFQKQVNGIAKEFSRKRSLISKLKNSKPPLKRTRSPKPPMRVGNR